MDIVKKKSVPPWKKKLPKGRAHNKLTAAEKQAARIRAEKAGRRYPNLVDNMAILRARKKETIF